MQSAKHVVSFTRDIPVLILAWGLMALPAVAEVRVGHSDAVKNAVRRPNPEYNPMARQMRIQGDVEVEVKIGETGEVADVKVLTGNPMLSAPVVKAVKDWKFTPFTEDGKAAPAVANLRFTFKQ